jgi:lipopolysaccharide/colanic/teichoic acid biosynthesis glycosyltransferase
MVRCDTGQEALVGSNQVTPFGNLLRRTRFDEFPQLWSVIKGDLSLIGPRPEIPELVNIYEKEIPYYSMRHLMKPGLSGWAQLYGEHSHGGVNINSTINKLSYDLFYFKNRSLMLDFKIALKTIKKILTRSGK